jgi:hypothetical protein
MVFYANPKMAGLEGVGSLGDGYTVNVRWYPAYPITFTNRIAYHIYYSTSQYTVFTEGIKYVVFDPGPGGCVDGTLEANIPDLTPGQDYWWAVRPVEYDPTIFTTILQNLPIAFDNVRFYPSSMLRQDMSATDLIVPLLSVEGFTSTGFVKVGAELIEYLAVDPINDNLIVPGPGGGIPPKFVLQSNNLYYLPGTNNVGQGSLANLALVPGATANTETWTLKCAFVEKDNMGNPMPSTAKFQLFGSISGVARDQYTNELIWVANGLVVSSNIMSFSVVETSPPFEPGDIFTMEVQGSIPGAPGGRGWNNTPITEHTICGFDGYQYWSPTVSEIIYAEDANWDQIYACESRFEYPHFPFTMVDGYSQVTTDYLSTDYSAADAANVTFPEYDFAGYHRTDLVQLVNGTCVGSYIGGQQGCIDGYGNYNVYRGISMQDQNTQRQDLKLQLDGQPACLIRRVQTGITCSCYLMNSEYPDDRCPFCYGTKFVFGYEQYFDPRHSDGRILVRLSPTDEVLKMYEAGLESEFPLAMWTLTVPTIKMRDVLVLFDQDGNESFRYEVAAVTRNQTFIGLDGGQNLKTFRVRKTDPIYQIRIFRDTADFPQTLSTSLGFAPGLPPHSHTIQVNEGVLAVCQVNQTTGVSQGHNHPIVNGQVMEVLGHTHQIILP